MRFNFAKFMVFPFDNEQNDTKFLLVMMIIFRFNI